MAYPERPELPASWFEARSSPRPAVPWIDRVLEGRAGAALLYPEIAVLAALREVVPQKPCRAYPTGTRLPSGPASPRVARRLPEVAELALRQGGPEPAEL